MTVNQLRYLVAKIWEQIPTEIKNNDSLVGFKKEIKKMETRKLHLQNLQNLYIQLRFYLAFYFRINVRIFFFFLHFINFHFI